MRMLTPEWVNPATSTLTAKSVEFLHQMDTLNRTAAPKVKVIAVLPAQALVVNYRENVTAYREMFPPGMLPTGAASRSSVPELEIKFQKFFKVFPEITWDSVLEATRIYVDKYAEQEYNWMKTSSNFISKADLSSGNVSYELASRCDMLSQEDAPSAQQHYTIRSV